MDSKLFDPNDYLIKLKGKDYLEVRWRLVWFRQDHPEGRIDTELIEHTVGKNGDPNAVFKATVSYETVDSFGNRVIASAASHGSEEKSDFGDYLEKSETKAIGRALAALGYGTQFTDEHDFGGENGRVVDAPTERKSKGNAGGGAVFACENCGSVIKDTTNKTTGSIFTAEKKAEISKSKYGKTLCWNCQKEKAS